jgi:hypothetical protein
LGSLLSAPGWASNRFYENQNRLSLTAVSQEAPT